MMFRAVRNDGDTKGQRLGWHQGDRDMGTWYLGDGGTKGKCLGLGRGDRDTVLRTKLR